MHTNELCNVISSIGCAVAESYGAGLAIARLLCTNANSACHPYGVG